MKVKAKRIFNTRLYAGLACLAAFAAVIGIGLGTAEAPTPTETAVLPPVTDTAPVDANKNAPASPVAELPEEEEEEMTAALPEEQALETADAEFEAAQAAGTVADFLWPADGAVVLGFSLEAAVYDPTLEQYRTNDSICISAPEGTAVRASAAGTVLSVADDGEKGVTVVIDHKNGWETTYSQMTADVAPGQSVAAGEVIGAVTAPTKYGVALGPHLEFKMVCDGSPADPVVAVAE